MRVRIEYHFIDEFHRGIVGFVDGILHHLQVRPLGLQPRQQFAQGVLALQFLLRDRACEFRAGQQTQFDQRFAGPEYRPRGHVLDGGGKRFGRDHLLFGEQFACPGRGQALVLPDDYRSGKRQPLECAETDASDLRRVRRLDLDHLLLGQHAHDAPAHLAAIREIDHALFRRRRGIAAGDDEIRRGRPQEPAFRFDGSGVRQDRCRSCCARCWSCTAPAPDALILLLRRAPAIR
jgi:hypothetical protein